MIDSNLLFALISFYFVMYVTPGPNNAMVLASGLKFGFIKTIPHMSGIAVNFSLFGSRKNFFNISSIAKHIKNTMCIIPFVPWL